jgi:hypothetical protein
LKWPYDTGSVLFRASADLRSLLAAVGLGERNPRSDDKIEKELIWTQARSVDGVVDGVLALLAAQARLCGNLADRLAGRFRRRDTGVQAFARA